MAIPKDVAMNLRSGDRVYARDPFFKDSQYIDVMAANILMRGDDDDEITVFCRMSDDPDPVMPGVGAYIRLFNINSENIWPSKETYHFARAAAIQQAKTACEVALANGVFDMMSFKELAQVAGLFAGDE